MLVKHFPIFLVVVGAILSSFLVLGLWRPYMGLTGVAGVDPSHSSVLHPFETRAAVEGRLERARKIVVKKRAESAARQEADMRQQDQDRDRVLQQADAVAGRWGEHKGGPQVLEGEACADLFPTGAAVNESCQAVAACFLLWTRLVRSQGELQEALQLKWQANRLHDEAWFLADRLNRFWELSASLRKWYSDHSVASEGKLDLNELLVLAQEQGIEVSEETRHLWEEWHYIGYYYSLGTGPAIKAELRAQEEESKQHLDQREAMLRTASEAHHRLKAAFASNCVGQGFPVELLISTFSVEERKTWAPLAMLTTDGGEAAMVISNEQPDRSATKSERRDADGQRVDTGDKQSEFVEPLVVLAAEEQPEGDVAVGQDRRGADMKAAIGQFSGQGPVVERADEDGQEGAVDDHAKKQAGVGGGHEKDTKLLGTSAVKPPEQNVSKPSNKTVENYAWVEESGKAEEGSERDGSDNARSMRGLRKLHSVQPERRVSLAAALPVGREHWFLNRDLFPYEKNVSFVLQYFKHPDNIRTLVERLYGCRAQMPSLSSELLANVDEPGDYDTWMQARNATDDFLIPVFSHNIHEQRGYNRLGRMATGEMLVFLQDDQLPPEDCSWLGDLLAAYAHYPQVGVIGLNTGVYSSQEAGWRMNAWNGDNIYLRNSAINVDMQFVVEVDLAPFTMRRRAFDELGGFNEVYSKPGEGAVYLDYELSIRAWLAGYHVAQVAMIPGMQQAGPSGTRSGKQLAIRMKNEGMNGVDFSLRLSKFMPYIDAEVLRLNLELEPVYEGYPRPWEEEPPWRDPEILPKRLPRFSLNGISGHAETP